MPVRNITRGSVVKGTATPTSAPIYVDSDDNKLKIIPAGSGTTEVEVLDASSAQSVTGKTLAGNIESDIKVLAADFTAASGDTGTTLTSLTGFSWTVVAGKTYKFRLVIPKVTMTTNGGLKLALKLTTTVLASLLFKARSSTDTDNTGAVSAAFTTATDQASIVAQNAVAFTGIVVEGTFVVTTGGTVAVQAAQNASHVDTTTITAGAFAELTRVN